MSSMEQPSSNPRQGQVPETPESTTATRSEEGTVSLSTASLVRATSSPSALRPQAEFFITGMIPVGAQHDDDDCGICTDALAHDVVQILACGHMFHTTCILPWLQDSGANNRTCPYCRQELFLRPTCVHAAPAARRGEGEADRPHAPTPQRPSPAQHGRNHLAPMQARRPSVVTSRPVAAGAREREGTAPPLPTERRARGRLVRSRDPSGLSASRTSGPTGPLADREPGPQRQPSPERQLLEEDLAAAYRCLSSAQDSLRNARTTCAVLETHAPTDEATRVAVRRLANAIVAAADAERYVDLCVARLESN